MSTSPFSPESPLSSVTSRRSFVRTGIASAAATIGCAPAFTPPAMAGGVELRTPLCDLLGIRYPIVQAGMAPVAGPELAAAVSEAGGLGILAAAHMPPDEVRRRIRRLRELTDRPFGVNLLLHSEVWPPVDTASFSDSVVQGVHAVLNRFRRTLGLAETTARPAQRPNYVPEVIEVMLEEKVPVFSIGLGNPPKAVVDRFHAQGAKVIAMVCTVEDAQTVAASGVDAIIAQGWEAGGHRSTWAKKPTPQHSGIGTFVLVPQVVDAVRVPVLAAGGVTTGRGIVAALALGAQGVLVGTRFIATRESRAVDFYKDALRTMGSDATVVTDAYTGLYARLIRNDYISQYDAAHAPVLTGYVQGSAARDIVAAAGERRDTRYYPMWAGQGIGMIHDIPSTADVVAALVRESGIAMTAMRARVGAT